MDLQAAENKVEFKRDWACPCNGCTKAVKQERKRILAELDKIELNTPSQLNAVGLKILMAEIINDKVNK